jgi:hypothetical protein
VTPNEVSFVFDAFLHETDPNDPAVLLGWLADELEHVRRRCSPTAWRAACQASRTHALFALLERDPFIASARRRDGGVPLGARVIDHLLLPHWHRPYGDAIGVELHRQSTGSGFAAAMRTVHGTITSAIVMAASRAADRCQVVAIASGYARELQRVRAELRRSIDFVHVTADRDAAASLAIAETHRARLAALPLGEWRRARPATPAADLVYAPGLCAFLTDELAGRVIHALAGTLRPGGQLLLVNPTSANWERGFVEAVLGVYLTYRNIVDWPRLTSPLDPSLLVRTSTSADERLTWLTVTRSV